MMKGKEHSREISPDRAKSAREAIKNEQKLVLYIGAGWILLTLVLVNIF